MRLDAQTIFVPFGGQSMVAAAGVSIASTNTLDLIGSGPGTTPPNIIGTQNALFGEDVGIGDGFLVPKLIITTGTAFVTANSATLNVALQLAPDTAVTHLPGTWQTVEETGAMIAAQLLAAIVIGRLDWAPAFPANLNPRYARLLFQVPSGTNFSAGTIAFAGVTSVRDDQANKFAQKNFTVQ